VGTDRALHELAQLGRRWSRGDWVLAGTSPIIFPDPGAGRAAARRRAPLEGWQHVAQLDSTPVDHVPWEVRQTPDRSPSASGGSHDTDCSRSPISQVPPTTRRGTAVIRCQDAARPEAQGERHLVAFTDRRGAREVVVTQGGVAGSVLVIDRAGQGGDRVLVAQLFPEEPSTNADLLAAIYAEDCQSRRLRCAGPEQPSARQSGAAELAPSEPEPPQGGILQGSGCSYGIELAETGMSVPELRWMRTDPRGCSVAVSVRDVVAGIQSYEPVLSTTMRLLAHHGAGDVSRSVLRAELTRVLESPIVLNRRLRRL